VRDAVCCGDIGCYTLGNAMPLDMVDSCICMGGGFTVPQGMHWASPNRLHLGFVGDSTFFASGITGAANAVYNQSPVVLFVLDNSITAMTGSQPHPGTGIRMSADASSADSKNAIEITAVLRALGLGHVGEADPLAFASAVSAAKAAISYSREQSAPSAVVYRAPCITVAPPAPQPDVCASKCTLCRQCIDTVGCPALELADSPSGHRYVTVNSRLCYGCDLCVQLCPFAALVSTHDRSGDGGDR
jgi:indolepyruvate ferredoxin oxidoreductase alpha subunit